MRLVPLRICVWLFFLMAFGRTALCGATPVITGRPRTQLVTLGQSATFTIAATSDSGALAYQWRHNGQDISGATNTTYTIGSVARADRGSYEVVVSNISGTTRSVFRVGLASGPTSGLVPVKWGTPDYTTTKVLPVPAGLGDLVAISGALGLRSDGTLVALDGSAPPAGADWSNVASFSGYPVSGLAVKTDETVVTWGIPGAPASVKNAIDGATGSGGQVVLQADGTLISWGGSGATVPVGLSDVVAVAAAADFVALKRDGTVTAWGSSPFSVPAGLGGVVAISAGFNQDLALKSDGTVAVWGYDRGQLLVPHSAVDGIDISSGTEFCMLAKADGTVVSWGNFSVSAGPVSAPAVPTGVAAVGAGDRSAFALAQPSAPAFVRQPAGGTVNTGTTVTVSALGSGVPLPTYQWAKDGTPLHDGGTVAGSSTARLTITNAQLTDAGTYSVTLASSSGAAVSAPAVLAVAVPPVITRRPLSQRVTAGGSATFSAGASDPGQISYQWRRFGQAVPGATGSSLTLTNVARADEGIYELDVTNAAGGLARSFVGLYVTVPGCTVVGLVTPTVGSAMTPPAGTSDIAAIACGSSHLIGLKTDGTVIVWGDTTYGEGNISAGLSGVVAIGAVGAGSYALKNDGTVVSWGQLANTAIRNEQNIIGLSASGDRLLALRADGSVYDGGNGPIIVTPPVNSGPYVALSGNENHAAGVEWDGHLAEWSAAGATSLGVSDDAPLARSVTVGYTTVMALLPDGTVAPVDSSAQIPTGLNQVVKLVAGGGVYYALKSDGTVVDWREYAPAPPPVLPAGLSMVSDLTAGSDYAFALVLTAPPVITVPPADQSSFGGTATFHADATGTAPLTYRWNFNGTPLSDGPGVAGSATTTLVLSNVKGANAGDYSLTVTNFYGSVTSTPAKLSGPPVISGPAQVSLASGAATTLLTSVPGTGPFTYQWRKDGEPLAGVTNANFSVGAATRFDAGTYDVTVTVGGTTVVSNQVVLLVAPPQYPGRVTLDPATNVAAELFDGWIYTTAVDANGKLYVGGDFSSINGKLRSRVARFNADGTLDSTFVPPPLNGPVYALAPTPDGKLWVGGDFKNVAANPGSCSYIALLNSDGSVTRLPVLPFAGNTVYALAALNNGSVLCGGRFTAADPGANSNNTANYLMRILFNGAFDSSFRTGIQAPAGGAVESIAIQPDGKILAGGYFYGAISGSAVSGSCILRVTSGGALDTTFGIGTAGANSDVSAIVVQPDGRIVIGGFFNAVNGQTVYGLGRLTPTGQLDAGFNLATSSGLSGSSSPAGIQGVDNGVYSMAVQTDGKIVVGGAFTTYNGVAAPGLMRIKPDGTRDTAFTAAPNSEVSGVALQANGEIVAVGFFTGVNNEYHFRAVRLKSDGTIDASFSPLPLFPGKVDALLPMPGGKVVVGGLFDFIAGRPAPSNLARLNADLTLDTSFNASGAGPDGEVTLLGRVGDGRTWASGKFLHYNGTAETYLLRVNADGTPDTTFVSGTGPGTVPTTLVPLPGARVAVTIAGGTYNGTSQTGVFRIGTDGKLDPTFAMKAWFSSQSAIGVAPDLDGFLVCGGSGGLIRVDGAANALAVDLAASNYDTIGHQVDGANLVASSTSSLVPQRILPNGTRDPAYKFDGGMVKHFDLMGDNRSFASGTLGLDSVVGGQAWLGLYNADGTHDTSFEIFGLSGAPAAYALLDDGRMLVSGNDTPGLAVTTTVPPPTITAQPVGPPIFQEFEDMGLSFSVKAMAAILPLSYQWYKNGVAIPGATNDFYTGPQGLGLAASGDYKVVVTSFGGSTTSSIVTVTEQPTVPDGLMLGVAQSGIPAGGHSLAMSFTVQGEYPKPLLIRAVGPGLGGLGVSGYMTDPQLTIARTDGFSNTVVATNDNWGSETNATEISAATAQLGLYPLAAGSKDAAVMMGFAQGNYRATIGPAAASGIASLEIYETNAESRLVYLSTLATVPVGGSFIQGFTLAAPQGGRRYEIRAVGPSLGQPGALADPKLTVFSGSTVIATNDDWGASPDVSQFRAIGASQLPAGSKDAIVIINPASSGNFTVQVTGAGGAGGTVLVEIYVLDNQLTTQTGDALISGLSPVSVLSGQTATLGVVMSGLVFPAFQWSKDGKTIEGATDTTLVIPAAQASDAGSYSLSVNIGSASSTFTSALTVIPAHSADIDGDSKISLLELTRVIELYNTRNGTTRTGSYRLDSTGEDGFAPDASRAAGSASALARYHSADTNADGSISLIELTRVIELYNYRNGTTRTGQYHVEAGTEDGFAPGPGS